MLFIYFGSGLEMTLIRVGRYKVPIFLPNVFLSKMKVGSSYTINLFIT
jgi:hypothetical protein